jgi:hypothetical protein
MMLEKIVTFQQYAGFEDLFKKFGARDDVPDLDDEDIPTVVEQIRHDGAIRAALGKSNSPSLVLDLSIPQDDVDGDEPLYKSPRIVFGVKNALLRTGDEKFVKVIATIRRVFAGHEEEMDEAIEIATRVRNDARNEAIAQI